MGTEADVANLIAAFHAQQRLGELESGFRAGVAPAAKLRAMLAEMWPHARKAFYWCASRIDDDIRAAIACGKIAGVAGQLLEQTQGRHLLIDWRETAAHGAERAIASGHRPGGSEFDLVHDLLGHLTYVGYLHFANGNAGRAKQVLLRALEVGRIHDRHFADAVAMLHLGFVAVGEGDLDEAERLLLAALDAHGQDQSAAIEAAARLALGVVYSRRERLDAALEQCERTVELFERLNDLPGLCTALVNRAGVQLDLGRSDLAREDLRRASEIADQIGSGGHRALIKANLARLRAHEQPDDTATINELLHESFKGFDHIEDRMQRERIGSMLEALFRSALDQGGQSLTPTQRLSALRELVTLANVRGDVSVALERAQQLLRAAEEMGDELDLVEALAIAAKCGVSAGEYGVARDAADRALAMRDRLQGSIAADQSQSLEWNVRSLLGQCLRHLGETEAAVHQLRAGVDAANGNDNEDAVRLLRGNLGLALADLGEFDEAIELLRSVKDDLEHGMDYRLAGLAKFNLAYALYRKGDLGEARRLAEEALETLRRIGDPSADEVIAQVEKWYDGGRPEMA